MRRPSTIPLRGVMEFAIMLDLRIITINSLCLIILRSREKEFKILENNTVSRYYQYGPALAQKTTSAPSVMKFIIKVGPPMLIITL